MKVAVVSAYYNEPLEVIRRCHDSVLAQSHLDCTHILVSDGIPNPEIDAWKAQHLRLPVSHSDYGDTPRFVGAVTAFAQGFDALCWLDADNWLEPEHVANLLGHLGDGVTVVTSARMLRRPDGSILGRCEESNGREFSDTNCYLLARDAMHIAVRWGFKSPDLAVIGDRLVWAAAQRMAKRVHSPEPTVNYTTLIASHYLERGEEPPVGAKVICKMAADQPFQCVLYKDIKR